MPVILSPKDYKLWLDHNFRRIDKLQELLKPYAVEEMISYPVCSIVNSPKMTAKNAKNQLLKTKKN
jgi:putative SOS response-associated peptidase YedK